MRAARKKTRVRKNAPELKIEAAGAPRIITPNTGPELSPLCLPPDVHSSPAGAALPFARCAPRRRRCCGNTACPPPHQNRLKFHQTRTKVRLKPKQVGSQSERRRENHKEGKTSAVTSHLHGAPAHTHAGAHNEEGYKMRQKKFPPGDTIETRCKRKKTLKKKRKPRGSQAATRSRP